mgnify:CR=1 FL=1
MFRKRKIKKFILGKVKIYLRSKHYSGMNNHCKLVKINYMLSNVNKTFKLKLKHYANFVTNKIKK